MDPVMIGLSALTICTTAIVGLSAGLIMQVRYTARIQDELCRKYAEVAALRRALRSRGTSP